MIQSYPEARRAAKRMLAEANVRSAPVDIEALANFVGAEVHYASLNEDIAGLVTRLPDGRPIIGINAADAPVRQRFSIAHEIGHLKLHKELLHIDKKFPLAFRRPQSSSGPDRRESEANAFAAELLMPDFLLERDTKRYADEEDVDVVIPKLAAKYRVSTQAMTIRLTSLGYIR